MRKRKLLGQNILRDYEALKESSSSKERVRSIPALTSHLYVITETKKIKDKREMLSS